jgi:AraC-like DNA-binding protein
MPKYELKFDINTVDSATREDFEAYRELIGRAVMKLEMEPLSRQDFGMENDISLFPNLGIGESRSRNLYVRRTAALIDGDEGDHVVFAATLGGSRMIHQCGREIVVSQGEATLVVGSETGHSSVADERSLTFKLPRALIAPLVGDIDATAVRLIPRETEALRLLIQYGRALLATEPVSTPEIVYLAASHVADLIALAVGTTRDGAEIAGSRGRRAARLVALRRDIRKNLTQPQLSVSALATRHRISTSYIRKLFDSMGTTFTDFVLEQRLARAHRMLSDPRSEQPIGAIAFQCGFGDLSYFNRTFRKQYGLTPSDVRKQAYG